MLGEVAAVDERPGEIDFGSGNDVSRRVLLYRSLGNRLFTVVTHLSIGFGLIRRTAAGTQGVFGTVHGLLKRLLGARVFQNGLRGGTRIRVAVGVAANQIRIATHDFV